MVPEVRMRNTDPARPRMAAAASRADPVVHQAARRRHPHHLELDLADAHPGARPGQEAPQRRR